MNGFSAAATSSSFPIPPSNITPETGRVSFPTARPEFSSFKFNNIGQPPTLLSRFSDTGATSDYRSPSPERTDMDIASPEDPTMMVTDDHRTFHPAPRKSLLDMLGGSADQGHNPKTTITQTGDPGVVDPVATSPVSASSSRPVFPPPESRLSSISRQLSAAVDVPHAGTSSSRASAVPEIHTYEPPDSDMIDLYADPASPSQSPLSLFTDLSEAVRESAELDRIVSLHHVIATEREELLARQEETTRAHARTKTQLDRVLSLTDEAIQMTAVFVEKEKARLETKKTNAEAKIERRKHLEAEQRRKAKESERNRQHEQERKAQVEMEQQVARQRLEEQRRKEEALATERQRQEEILTQERAQAEERSCIEEEERRRLAEEDRRRRDEEERKRQAEEEEHIRRKLAEEKEVLARKQEEDRKIQLFERRRLAEEERKREEAGAIAAEAEAERQAAEKEQQRIFQERRATVLKDKYKNYNRSEPGVPPTGPSSTSEEASSSSLPSIIFNDAPPNPQAVAEQYPGITKIHRTRDTPTFVPATTEAGRLPPDLALQVKILNGSVDNAVKDETTSPVITPVDDAQPAGGTPPRQLPSRPISMANPAPVPAPAPLHAPSHLPARPGPKYSRPPVPTSSQQRGRSPHRYPPRRSRSRSRSPSRSPRRGSSTSRIPSRTSRSPDSVRGRHPSPFTGRRVDHYSPPHSPYRDGGSRYDRDRRSDSPPPPPLNPRKRPVQDSWASANTPSKLDYSHPAKRRASPLRSTSPPSPRPRPLSRPPPVIPARRQLNRRGRGAVPPSHLPLEQRLSRPPLSGRLQWDSHP